MSVADSSTQQRYAGYTTDDNLYRTVFVYSEDAIFVIDPSNNKIIDVNPAACRILGYTRDELLALPISALHPTEMPQFLDFARRVSEEGRGRTEELTCRHKHGEAISADIAASVITDAYDQRRLIVMLRDNTERKRAEDTVRQAQEQIRQAQKMEALGRLAGGVAHDFNNFLGVIVGYFELLLRKLPDDESEMEYANEFRKTCRQAAELVQQLLTFGRKKAPKAAVTDLGAALLESRPLLGALLTKRINLQVFAPRMPIPVSVDQTELLEVLMNLAANARDAMPEGGIFVVELSQTELSAKEAEQRPPLAAGSHAVLRVKDTGVGITPETLTHLFEPFFTTKQPGKGTGLGLATVYAIVKQRGGAIFVESQPSMGTSFTIFLPVEQ